VYGAKKWIIYPPSTLIMSNEQILKFYEDAVETLSKENLRPLTCVQTAGNMNNQSFF
jgi:hypothetical protein